MGSFGSHNEFPHILHFVPNQVFYSLESIFHMLIGLVYSTSPLTFVLTTKNDEIGSCYIASAKIPFSEFVVKMFFSNSQRSPDCINSL